MITNDLESVSKSHEDKHKQNQEMPDVIKSLADQTYIEGKTFKEAHPVECLEPEQEHC